MRLEPPGRGELAQFGQKTAQEGLIGPENNPIRSDAYLTIMYSRFHFGKIKADGAPILDEARRAGGAAIVGHLHSGVLRVGTESTN